MNPFRHTIDLNLPRRQDEAPPVASEAIVENTAKKAERKPVAPAFLFRDDVSDTQAAISRLVEKRRAKRGW